MDNRVTLSVRTLLVAGLVALALLAAYLIGRAGPAPASAQPDDQTADAGSTVTVTGVGHVAVVPDQLAFDLSVSVLRPDLDQALDDGNTSMQAVVDQLKASGVADKDVQTTDLSMNPEYEKKKGQPARLTGYRVSNSVSVVVEDFEKASAIVTAALNAGGSGVHLNGLRLQVGDPDASLGPARTAALDQAHEKAQEYADHAGGELGEVVTISEVTDRQAYGDQLDYRASAAADMAAFPIQAGQEDLTASIVVVYELK
jgi:uncharacterized protein